MTRNGLKALALVAAAAGTGVPTTAHAVCDGCVVGAVTAANIAIVGAVKTSAALIVNSVGLASTAITTAMEFNTQLILQGISAGSSAISQTVKESSDIGTQTNLRYNSDVQAAMAAMRYQVTDPCAVVAPALGLDRAVTDAGADAATFGRGGVATSTGGARGGGGSYRAGRGASAQMAAILNVAEGKAAAPSPEAAAVQAAEGACGTFVSGGVNAMRASACTAAKLPAASAGAPDADIRAETLFMGPQRNPGAAKTRLTVDYAGDDVDRVALAAFMRNINTPLELRSLSKGELNSDAGRRFLSVKDAYEGRMSLAEFPMRRKAAGMQASKETIPMVEQMLKSKTDAAFAQRYLDANAPAWRGKGLSADEALNLDVLRRHANLDWQAGILAMPPEERLSEQLRLTALQNMLLWRLTQEVRDLTVLAGASYGSNVRAEMLPELRAVHQAAQR